MEGQTIEQLGSDYEPLRDTALALPDQARLIVIRDDEELAFANEWARHVVLARIDAIKDFFRDRKARAHAVWKDMVALEQAALEPCEAARKIVDRAVLTYNERQAERRRQAEEEARRLRAEEERRALLARAPALLAAAISYVATCIQEDERREAAAAAAEKAGDVETAEAMKQEIGRHDAPVLEPELLLPPIAPPIMVPEAPRAVAGASVRKNWKARVIDKMALVRFVAAHPEYENLLEVNQSAADKQAKSLEGRLAKAIPGLEGYNDPSVSRKR